MSAVGDITPRVIEHIRAGLPAIDRRRRVGFLVAQVVLRQLARMARKGDGPGLWIADDSVGQIEVGTGLAAGQICKALDNLRRLGLVETLRRGGGPGLASRGSVRLLILDPTGAGTPRAKRAQFGGELRALGDGTPRATTRTPRAQARDSVSSSVLTSARAQLIAACPRCESDGYITHRDRHGRRFAELCTHEPEPATATAPWMQARDAW